MIDTKRLEKAIERVKSIDPDGEIDEGLKHIIKKVEELRVMERRGNVEVF